uniref:Glycerol-3-phosphate acyltransferase 1, mitochondrial n=1 Tax=Poecilia latipinna TaxID=48699 RepID=A0A3B3UJW7_9TELE
MELPDGSLLPVSNGEQWCNSWKHPNEDPDRSTSPSVLRSCAMTWKEGLLNRKRPFVGRCCHSCTPQSWEQLFNPSIPSLGLRNVIYINETNTRQRGWLARRLSYVLFVTERDVHKDMFTRNVVDNVLNSSRVESTISKVAAESEAPVSQPVSKVKQKARAVLQEMVANVSPPFIRLTGWVLLRLFNGFFWSIQIHKGQLEMVKKAAAERKLPMIFLPVHKSHIDYLLITLILFCHNIKAPHIAAGNNLSIPILSTVIRKLGGFFIRRRMEETADGKKDILYRSLLHTGKPKQNESWWGIACGVFRMLRKNYGCVRVDFNQPFSLKEYLDTQRSRHVPPPVSLENALMPYIISAQADGQFDEQEEEAMDREVPDELFRRHVINNLAKHVLFTANKSSAIMSTHIVACLLLYRHRQGVVLTKLVEDFFNMKEEILSRDFDLGFSGDSEDVVMRALHLLEKCINVTGSANRNGEFTIAACQTVPALFELNFYSNGLFHVYIPDAIIACSILSLQRDLITESPHQPRDCSSLLLSQERLIHKAAGLSHFLTNEVAVAPPCQTIYQVLNDAVTRLIQCGVLYVAEEDQEEMNSSPTEEPWPKKFSEPLSWRSDEEDEDSDFGEEQRDRYVKVSLAAEHQEFFIFLQRLLSPVLEAYSGAAVFVHGLSQPMPESDFTLRLFKYLLTRTERGVAAYGESATHYLVKNTVKTFKELGVLKERQENRVSVLELSSTFQPQANRNKLLQYILSFTLL